MHPNANVSTMHYGTLCLYSPASRFPLRLVGFEGGAEPCLAGAFPFFLECGTSLVLWLAAAVAAALFGGTVAFLALGLGLGGGGGKARDADVTGLLERGFSMNEKVNRKQLTQRGDNAQKDRQTRTLAALLLGS